MEAARVTLENEGYVPSDHPRILAKKGFTSIAYSDGAGVEDNLLAILKKLNDVSVLSPELQHECKDWVTQYHFSHTRANLLRPFEQALRGRVLELGAGCGGVTRYLGEISSEVVAVEGSRKRCEINAERTRDLPNVSIVGSELSEFETSLQFDAVVVVGVLEYAALFTESDTPQLDFLHRAFRLIKPGGSLLLAIENKLGLKYLAGAPEDHFGLAMFGIEDRYSKNGIRTFSQSELLKLFRDAGFQSNFVHAPFPDYKLTRAVVTSEGLASDLFDSGRIAAALSYHDPNLPESTFFDLSKAWPVASAASLDSQLSNSFLVEARKSANVHSGVIGKLAFWYGGDRKPQYLREKVFSTTERGKIEVSVRALADIKEIPDGVTKFSQRPEPNMAYQNGDPYSKTFDDLLSKHDWTTGDLAKEVLVFMRHCEEYATSQGVTWNGTPDGGRADGSLVDLVPQNAVLGDDNRISVFDQEWQFYDDIPISYLFFRVCFTTLASPGHKGRWLGEDSNASILTALERLMEKLGFDRSQLEQALHLEWELQNLVSTKGIDKPQFEEYLSRPLVRRSFKDALLADKDALLTAMRASLSWKVTKPLRLLGKTFLR